VNERPLPRYKLWIAKGDVHSVFGDGKYVLLDAIRKTGSIRKAADALRISYRKAWGDLKTAEEGMGIKLIEKIRGGKYGGSTVLTKACLRILSAYSRFKKAVDLEVKASFKYFFKEI
jgi:molybdate transport system regulatory protein